MSFRKNGFSYYVERDFGFSILSWALGKGFNRHWTSDEHSIKVNNGHAQPQRYSSDTGRGI